MLDWLGDKLDDAMEENVIYGLSLLLLVASLGALVLFFSGALILSALRWARYG